MLNRRRIIDDIIEIAFMHPTDTILIKVYNRNGEKDVYASDYFLRKVDDIMLTNVWQIKIVIISGVVEGRWKITGSQTYEDNTSVDE